MCKILFFCTCFVFLLGSCSAPTGLKKTQFSKWERREFQEIALSVDVPVQPFSEKGGLSIAERASQKEVSIVGYKDICVQMHPVFKGYIDEPYFLIEIFIVRISEENYKQYKEGKGWLIGYNQFRNENQTYFNILKMYQAEVPGAQGRKKDNLLILRKDYRDANGDYILCGGSLYAGSDKYVQPEDEDINAVERILNSVVLLKK